MSYAPLSGSKTRLFDSVRGSLVDSGDTTLGTWYEIASVASSGSTLPIGKVGAVFRSPALVGDQVTLASGDSIYPLTLSEVCKTDAELSFEEGTIDVTDDCEDGFTAEILDGYKQISGTINGFFKFDDETGELSTKSEDIFKRFINVVTDDGAGIYVETEASNEKFLMFYLLNKNAGVGDIMNWIICPIIIPGLSTGAALRDTQKRDLSFQKAPGYVSLYQRTASADDLES